MSFALAEETATVVEETAGTVGTVVKERTHLEGFEHIGESGLNALLGYLVVFIGLTLLMTVVIIVGKIMVAKTKKADTKSVTPAAAPAAVAPVAAPAAPKKLAPGSAGDVKIYDTDPRDAAMIMAIVADKLGKPLNELRFRSIKEVK
jgi:Na+-transporting methylmalonyl-CoA/oxaloacetate decarboxylase gamma subunit